MKRFQNRVLANMALILLLLLSFFNVNAQPGGYALDFDGTNDYVDCGSASSLDAPSAITVEAWINTDDIAGQVTPTIIKKSTGSNGFSLEIDESDNTVRFWVYISGDAWYSSPSQTLSTSSWYHLAGSYDGSVIQLYVDGEQIGSGTSISGTIANSNGGNLIIAHDVVNTDRYFDGRIDEVRVWDDVRTEAEIKTNMFKELAGNEANLAAYYKMSNASGTSLTDNSTNTNDGTLTNMDDTDWMSSGCLAGPRNALNFDGTDDVVIAPSFTERTVEMWIQPTVVGQMVFYSGATSGTTDNDFSIAIFETNGVGGSSTFDNDSSGLCLSFNNNDVYIPWYKITSGWHHVVCYWDGATSVEITIDGVQRPAYLYDGSSFTGPFTQPVTLARTPTPAAATSYIGAGRASFWGTGSANFTGNIDEVRIWNTHRTLEQIRENMFKNLDGDESGLVAYYRFDQNDGTILYDITGNGNDATLTNMDEATDWVTSNAYNFWLGGLSTSSSTAANWSRNAVPSSSESVGFYNWTVGNSSMTLAGNPTLQNMYIGSGFSLSISTSFIINNNLFVNSSISLPSSSTFTYVAGDLNVSSGVTLTMQANSKLSVNFRTFNAGTMILKSPASLSNSASLITYRGVINTGTMQIERWVSVGTLSSDDYNWHSIGLPIASTTSGTYFQGDYIYSYTEADNSWTNIIDVGTEITQGVGYIVKPVRGDKLYKFTGTFNTGTFNYTLTNSGPDAAHGYNLVSNPYPSCIDLASISGSNIYNTIWVWDPVSENYLIYESGIGGSLGQYLQPCQAFFVKVDDAQASGSLTIVSTARSHSTGGNAFKSAKSDSTSLIALKVSGGDKQDMLFINQSDIYNSGYKLFSMNPNVPQMYVIQNDLNYALYHIHEFTEDYSLPIGFKSQAEGEYCIETVNQDFDDQTVILKDKLLDTEQELSAGTKITFNHKISDMTDRFELIFNKKATYEDEIVKNNNRIKLYTDRNILFVETVNIGGTIDIYNLNGLLVKQMKITENGSTIQVDKPGMYIVKVTTAKEQVNKKIVIQ